MLEEALFFGPLDAPCESPNRHWYELIEDGHRESIRAMYRYLLSYDSPFLFVGLHRLASYLKRQRDLALLELQRRTCALAGLEGNE